MKNFIKDFKQFVQSRGNILDLAVGVIIGAAFGKIVSSLVQDIIMPIIGKISGGIAFQQKFIPLDGKEYPTLEAAREATATVAYGLFIQNLVDFIIIALVLFIIITQLSKLAKKKEEEAPKTKTCTYCKTEIALDATRCPHCTSEL